MESGVVSVLPEDKGSYIWIVILSIIFTMLWFSFQSLVNIAEIKANWPKYRCQPTIIPFANFFGHEVNENFNYCIKNVFSSQMGEFTGPFGTILGSLITTCMGFLQNLNSLRIMLATLVGGVTKVFQELSKRVQLILTQVKTSSMRMQFLMKRAFGTFYAVIYMALSGVQAGMNFGNTVIFGFLDTFCFPGDTKIDIQDRGLVPIREVILGDRLAKTGKRVISVYNFVADGQAMMKFPESKEYPYPILVSTNHLVKHNNLWISAEKHPEAIPAPVWSGGDLLYCLDTENHEIPIGSYMFSDYDETKDSDSQTMRWVENSLNTIDSTDKSYPWLYQPCCDPETHILLKQYKFNENKNSKKLSEISIGDEISSGLVVGIVKRHVHETVITPNGTRTTPSTLIWSEHCYKWERVGHINEEILYTEKPVEMISLIVMNSSYFETVNGDVIRDFMEVHSPDAEEETTKVLCPSETR